MWGWAGGGMLVAAASWRLGDGGEEQRETRLLRRALYGRKYECTVVHSTATPVPCFTAPQAPVATHGRTTPRPWITYTDSNSTSKYFHLKRIDLILIIRF